MISINVRRWLAPSVLVLASVSLALPVAAHASTEEEPTVSGGAAHAHGSSVVLSGSVNPGGLATTYDFEYGPTEALGAKTPAGNIEAGNAKVTVYQVVSSFHSGYHYRLTASNTKGTAEGTPHVYTAFVKPSGKTGGKSKGKGKPGKLKFDLTRPAGPVASGSTVFVSGTLAGVGSASYKIILQASAYPYIEAYKNLGSPQATTPGGRFSFRVAGLSKSTRYRVLTLEPSALYSGSITEQVAVRVSFDLHTISSSLGLVRLYGTVTPAEVGARVSFELERTPKGKAPKPAKSEKAEERAEAAEEVVKFSPEFSTLVKRGTRKVSRFSRVVTIHQEGRYRVFVLVGKGPLVSGYSREIFIHAPPSKKKKAKG